jgi:uncharacterized protein YecE (DUF72 family)
MSGRGRVLQPAIATGTDRVRIGTSGWSYPTGEGRWTGVVYPPGTRNELSYYATHLFDTVEVNASFYRLIPPATAKAWARITPPDFQFAVKAWQKFTHPRMHAAATGQAEPATQDDVDRFRASLDPLAERRKLAVVLFQFPPSFHATPDCADALGTLLGRLAPYPLAVELRHRSWSRRREETRRLLEEHRTTWVVIDEPKFPSSIRQEVEPLSEMLYLRFHGRNAAKWWTHDRAEERYDYLYSEAELLPFAARIRALLATARPPRAFVFFNNHARGQAVQNAQMMIRLIGEGLPS